MQNAKIFSGFVKTGWRPKLVSNSCQCVCNLERAYRINLSCVQSRSWGKWDCYARLWEVECEVPGGWKGPGYLCYCSKHNGIRVANGKQSFIICSQNNPFHHASRKSKGMSLLYVYMHACFLLHSISAYSSKYVLFLISSIQRCLCY